MRHLFSAVVVAVLGAPLVFAAADVNGVCKIIAAKVSNASAVFFPLTSGYAKDVSHWASSSEDSSVCSVEPGTPADVATVLNILGATATPFGVKGGGHASNPGFSSSPGVQISMARFNQVVYNASTQTATIGAGLIWDDVYAALEPHGVNVVGGRVSGVGVAGFTLGGGYSWKSNQLGLTVDTAVAYELVTPQGLVRTVTARDKDLFWALKGGGNRFGIVTRFTLKTFPQTQVWGGFLAYTGDKLDAVVNATLAFNSVTDKKAQLITTLNVLDALPGAVALLFYDAPTPPPGIFDAFLAIPSALKDIKTRSFLSLVQASPTSAMAKSRAIFNTVTLPDYTAEILAAIKNETLTLGAQLSLKSGSFISYDIEPFAKGFLNNPNRTSDSAFPPVRTAGVPLNIYYAWSLATSDNIFFDAARQSAARIQALAGRTTLPRYPNYAIFDTPLNDMFGAAGVQRLARTVKAVDPNGVMNLAGGFRFS